MELVVRWPARLGNSRAEHAYHITELKVIERQQVPKCAAHNLRAVRRT